MQENKKDKYKTMENIANGIHAAEKIQNLFHSSFQRDSEPSVRPDNLTLLNEALRILTHYSPEIHTNKLDGALVKSGEYSSAYKNIKQHFRTAKNQRINGDMMIKTLNVMKPIVDNHGKALIDKTLKIYEILNS